MSDDRRLIEDYLPIVAISAEASREKSVRKGHISTLHLWWARRPLVACRAAVYGALVPASRFVPNAGSDEKKKSLGRANAAKFVERLCQYPGSPPVIAEAQQHILEAHAERLTEETGQKVTVEDIVSGKAPRPKVLDMFAGGGAIPLEALRLGCEAYALDLNPVAHIIQLCTLVYPQKYGKPDPTARGMTGPKNANGETTWGGLADEVRYWGEWVLNRVKAEIGDLYPLIPDPEHKGRKQAPQDDYLKDHANDDVPPGYLMPVAYLWTRTVTCKNPNCKATVPLVRQTWLCKKPGRYVALKMVAPRGKKLVRFEIVETCAEGGLGFDPQDFSSRGNATCPFCGTVADSDYVKAEGCDGRISHQMMAVVCTSPGKQGKTYVELDRAGDSCPDDAEIRSRIGAICRRTGLTVAAEPIANDAKNANFCILYGLRRFQDLFNARQTLSLLTFVATVRKVEEQMVSADVDKERTKAVVTYLGLVVDRVAMFGNTLCAWYYQEQAVSGAFGRQALPMLWDYGEVSLNANISGGIEGGLVRIVDAIALVADMEGVASVLRGSAQQLPDTLRQFDAVITDPPYYDNIPYSNLADFFYVWLKRTVGHLYPEHFGAERTPKKAEAVARTRKAGI